MAGGKRETERVGISYRESYTGGEHVGQMGRYWYRYRPERKGLTMGEKEIPFLEKKIHQDPIFYSLWWSFLYSGSPEFLACFLFFPSTSVALFFSPTILRVSKICPNISPTSLQKIERPSTNAQGLGAWSSPHLPGLTSRQAASDCCSGSGCEPISSREALGAPSLCVCVAPTL